MIPEHFYDYQLIEIFIDMLQDEYEEVFTNPTTVYNLLLLHFPDEDISLESIESYFNVTSEELDINIHASATGVAY
jgi:calcineurin-like phosphoesterase family protein